VSSVASATDSESCGTLISTSMTVPFSFLAALGYPFGCGLQKQVRVARPAQLPLSPPSLPLPLHGWGRIILQQ
jgi:hypothetical protein